MTSKETDSILLLPAQGTIDIYQQAVSMLGQTMRVCHARVYEDSTGRC
jgi:hypothetical protein